MAQSEVLFHPQHTEDYSKVIGQYMIRQFLTPEITGWAQVNCTKRIGRSLASNEPDLHSRF